MDHAEIAARFDWVQVEAESPAAQVKDILVLAATRISEAVGEHPLLVNAVQHLEQAFHLLRRDAAELTAPPADQRTDTEREADQVIPHNAAIREGDATEAANLAAPSSSTGSSEG